jgi:hypothetical protein
MEGESMQKPGGRPRKFRNKGELDEAVAQYFAWCDETETPPTIKGLTFALGYTDTNALRYLAKESKAKGQFSLTIGRAKLLIEDFWNQKLVNPNSGPGTVAAAKHMLSSCFKWREKGEDKPEEKRGVKVVVDNRLWKDSGGVR